MYAYIKGVVASIGLGEIELECNGIGYQIFVSGNSISNMIVGDEVKIHTYYNVREDGVFLFGFLNKKEKDFFLNLITVNGVGPKVALGIISSAKFEDIISHIASANINELSKIKGIGKKTSERLVVELKDKLGGFGEIAFDLPKNYKTEIPLEEECVIALTELAFSRKEAESAVKKSVEQGLTSVEQILSNSLRIINKR